MNKPTLPILDITPFALIIRLLLVVVLAELFIMLVMDLWLKPLFDHDLPYWIWLLADPLGLVALKLPALYLWVFLPMQRMMQEREQHADILRQEALKIIAQDEHQLEQHRNVMAQRERTIHLDKLTALGTLVGGVAHEINNPLMGIITYVEYAHDHEADPKIKAVLHDALRQSERIRQLVANMLLLARRDSSQNARCNPQPLIAQTLKLMQFELDKVGATVRTELPPALPDIRCNAGSFQQVLLNLMINARDAVEGRPDGQITLRAEHDAAHLFLTVCDNGSGIPPDLRQRIFEPFFTTKPVGKGTGLGLSISRQLMQEVGGSLELRESEAPQETCFQLTFPLAAS